MIGVSYGHEGISELGVSLYNSYEIIIGRNPMEVAGY